MSSIDAWAIPTRQDRSSTDRGWLSPFDLGRTTRFATRTGRRTFRGLYLLSPQAHAGAFRGSETVRTAASEPVLRSADALETRDAPASASGDAAGRHRGAERDPIPSRAHALL